MKSKIILTVATLALFAAGNIFAATLYVGMDGSAGGSYYTVIQDAVDAAVAGDLILVSNGTYNTGGGIEAGSTLTNRVYCEKAIEIRSVDGPDSTFIFGAPDPNTSGHGPAAVRGVCLPWNSGATLDGFTITNGYTLNTGDSNREQGGGGARVRLASIIKNCVIIGNFAYGRGGGLNLQAGTADGCQILNNRAEVNTGGGVFAQNSGDVTPLMNNCVISGNTAYNGGGANGGGIYIYGNADIYNSTISGNICGLDANTGKGGGIFIFLDGTVQDCTISDNTAHLWGGGICVEDTAHGAGALVSRCKIQNNSTETHGGAGAMLYNAGVIQDSLIYQNHAATHAGGVYYVDGGKIVNCTIVSNVADENAGGVVIGTGTSSIENSIVLDNISSDPNTPNWSKGEGGTSLYTCTLPTAMNGVGNIATNALFVNAAAGNYNLQLISPCIDAGDNAYASSYDLDGNIRILDGTVDMGCYENSPIKNEYSSDYVLANLSEQPQSDDLGQATGTWYIVNGGMHPASSDNIFEGLFNSPSDGDLGIGWSATMGGAQVLLSDVASPSTLTLEMNCDFANAKMIEKINVFSGAGDPRLFVYGEVYYSSTGTAPGDYTLINALSFGNWGAADAPYTNKYCLTTLYNSESGYIAENVKSIKIIFRGVMDNYTWSDLTHKVEAGGGSAIGEVDIIGVPEPATLGLLAILGLAFLRKK